MSSELGNVSADADATTQDHARDGATPNGSPPYAAEPPGGRWRATRIRLVRRAAVPRWLPDSPVGQLWHRLQLLEFVNRGMLFAAVLLLCFVPFMITMQALEGRSVTTTLIRRFGLDQQAAQDVGHVFLSSTGASSTVTGLSWVFVLLGAIAAATALQELYEHAFGLTNRGWRDTHRQVMWLAALAGAGALANWTGPWLHDHGKPVLYPLAVLVAGTGFWWFTMWLLLSGRRGWRRLFPSALATGVCWLGVTLYFRFTMSDTIRSDYARYGPIGVVFAIMSLLISIGVVVILGALAGIVWDERREAGLGSAPAAAGAPGPRPAPLDETAGRSVGAPHGLPAAEENRSGASRCRTKVTVPVSRIRPTFAASTASAPRNPGASPTATRRR